MNVLDQLQQTIKKSGSLEKAKSSTRYFKTGKGEYGYGDKFYGITVPVQRKIAKEFFLDLSLADVIKLLHDQYHEVRFIALEILVMKFERAHALQNLVAEKQIYEAYLRSTKFINNWDLVDTSAEYIVGAYLVNKPRTILKKLAKSSNLWERRIAMVSCFYFIRQKDFADALNIATILLNDEHDLIHKAVGWMLREIGKRDLQTELAFLNEHTLAMPRTMLRYAIERFPEKLRLKYLRMV